MFKPLKPNGQMPAEAMRLQGLIACTNGASMLVRIAVMRPGEALAIETGCGCCFLRFSQSVVKTSEIDPGQKPSAEHPLLIPGESPVQPFELCVWTRRGLSKTQSPCAPNVLCQGPQKTISSTTYHITPVHELLS